MIPLGVMDEILRLATDWIDSGAITTTGLRRQWIGLCREQGSHHWTFNAPEEPPDRPVSVRAPRRRPPARLLARPVSPRRNRARSRPGGKSQARVRS